jgi:hypothetical protein
MYYSAKTPNQLIQQGYLRMHREKKLGTTINSGLWPACPPDLNPPDFYLRKILKQIAYR